MILYKNLPTIDLHGETGDIAAILVKNFVNDNITLKNEKIVVIHGIGKGIVKKAVHNELKNNKNVRSFKLDNFNEGQTIIELNL
mgnify:FL=1